jgi:hypothetical protein
MRNTGFIAMRRRARILWTGVTRAACLAALALAAGLAIPDTASADRWQQPRAEERERRWTGDIPACDDGRVLSRITARFDSRESRFWNSGIRLAEITAPRQVALRPWGDSYIPRRFCSAQVTLASESGMRRSRVDYIIIEGRGFLGQWGVEWCVADLVRHQHGGANCRAFRP